jgi:hypothetical protein
VAVTNTLGAHGWSVVLVGLASDGRLGLVKDEAHVVLDVPLAADVGCVMRSGDRLLVEGHGPQPSGAQVPTYAAEYLHVEDLHATLVGRRSAYGPRAVQSLQVKTWAASPRPAPVLDRLATSDQQAVLDLVRAVDAKDADQVAALVDPTFADTSTGEWEYDVFTYLTKVTNGVGWWMGHPVDSCMDTPDHECVILGTQGYPLDLELAQVDRRYWVVVGVKAG